MSPTGKPGSWELAELELSNEELETIPEVPETPAELPAGLELLEDEDEDEDEDAAGECELAARLVLEVPVAVLDAVITELEATAPEDAEEPPCPDVQPAATNTITAGNLVIIAPFKRVRPAAVARMRLTSPITVSDMRETAC